GSRLKGARPSSSNSHLLAIARALLQANSHLLVIERAPSSSKPLAIGRGAFNSSGSSRPQADRRAGVQNPNPKCSPKVTGVVATPLVGRLKRTGTTPSTKNALK